MSNFPRRRPGPDASGDLSPVEDGQAGRSLRLRPPETVMRLARLGAFHQTRLSFLRATLRHVAAGEIDSYKGRFLTLVQREDVVFRACPAEIARPVVLGYLVDVPDAAVKPRRRFHTRTPARRS